MSIFKKPAFFKAFNVELLRYLGPGFLVTVGFIDPGNWATNIAAGSEFGYRLLWVVTLSTLMLIFCSTCRRISDHTGECLAEACRRSGMGEFIFGGSIMLACVATALAEFRRGHSLTILTASPRPPQLSRRRPYFLVTVQKYDQIEHLIIALVSIIGSATSSKC